MRKIVFFVCAFAFSLSFASGQISKRPSKWIFGPSIGYQYQSGSFLKTGAWGLFVLNESQYMKLDAGASWTWMMDRTTVIPEFGATYYLNNVFLWPFVKAEVTPYTITPKVGISISSLLDIGVGYGFELQQKKDFKSIKGLSVSVGLNIPLNFHVY